MKGMKNIFMLAKDMPMGGVGDVVSPYLQICKKVGQKSAMQQESGPKYFL